VLGEAATNPLAETPPITTSSTARHPDRAAALLKSKRRWESVGM